MLHWRVEVAAPGRDPQMDPELARCMVSCGLAGCSKRVLLALECEWCGSKFCSEHALASEHECKGRTECPHCLSYIAVGTGDVSAAVTRHVADGACPAVAGRAHCPVPRCKQRLNAVNDFTCPQCSTHRGKRQMAEMNFDGATIAFQAAAEALAGHPLNAACKALREESLLGLARCKLATTRYQGCIDACKLVLASTSDAGRQSRARCAYGQALLATREYSAAVRQLEKAVATGQPTVSDAATPAAAAGGAAEAVASLRELMKQGKAQCEQGDFASAADSFAIAATSLEDYTHAADAKAAWVESRLSLAQCQLTLGRHQECVDLCNRLLSSTSNSERRGAAHYACGQGLQGLRDYAGALQHLHLAVGIIKQPLRRSVEASILEVLSRSQRCGADPASALAAGKAEQLMEQGKRRMQRQDFTGATAAFYAASEAVEAHTGNASCKAQWEECQLELARCHLRNVDYEACINVCTLLLDAKDSQDVRCTAHYLCGQALLAMGDSAAAVFQLKQAAAMVPEPFRLPAAEALEQAQRDLHDSAPTSPTLAALETAKPLVERGWQQMERENFEGAAATLQAAADTLAGHPGRTCWRRVTGGILASTPQAREALQAATQSLEQQPVARPSLAAREAPPEATAPQTTCLRCHRGRLDGALMHGTTLHICVCWACACELAEQRKPCPKCHTRFDQIARLLNPSQATRASRRPRATAPVTNSRNGGEQGPPASAQPPAPALKPAAAKAMRAGSKQSLAVDLIVLCSAVAATWVVTYTLFSAIGAVRQELRQEFGAVRLEVGAVRQDLAEVKDSTAALLDELIVQEGTIGAQMEHVSVQLDARGAQLDQLSSQMQQLLAQEGS
ncbi:Zinc finger AN1 and C2H2 domain-containing stress-associated [Chlorella sorokiniana]|uniref:Zinc finger AN1 and C2H2 domain-containing stress-associated n=1 Tax=Chlorella sorokiniana TaxID=3076 RepID=A0A2P6TT19_CHLSO|nr:Zinc finger AN1 and C2H2 domain-containing stress-associated [Chlorella sorokiniana]|eukprot:PRW57215.1 Zinc finger AN1 and C2H2 domain-containing stress-associated [Chlorella sorokiniana]